MTNVFLDPQAPVPVVSLTMQVIQKVIAMINDHTLLVQIAALEGLVALANNGGFPPSG